MEKRRLYMDYSATTPVKKEVLDEMMPYFTENFGNASSFHTFGREAKTALDKARGQVANLINAKPNEIYFTAGGTESDNWAIEGVAFAHRSKGNHIITSKIEHHGILHICEYLEKHHGFEVTYLDVDAEGRVKLDELEKAIKDTTILISIMFANNEIGTIQPIEEIAKIAHERNIVFHTDAVQAISNMHIDVKKMDIDMLSLSGHKINAPKGIGALYIKDGIKIEKYINGGHQERNLRAGTENVGGIVGIGKACELAKRNMDTHIKNLSKLRNYYIMRLQKEMPDKIRINGTMENRLPGNANVSFEGSNASELIFKLDEKGICVSSGSACSSGNTKPSHVLTAIDLPEKYLNSAIRTTFGDNNTFEQVDYLVKCLKLIL